MTCSRSRKLIAKALRARYRCLQRVASRQSGVTLSPLLASKLDINSRPEGSFFFICVFVFVACAIKKRVSKKKKKSPRTGGACATRATCELRACIGRVSPNRNEANSFEAAEWSKRLTSRRMGWLGAAATGSIPAPATFLSFSLLFFFSFSPLFHSLHCISPF